MTIVDTDVHTHYEPKHFSQDGRQDQRWTNVVNKDNHRGVNTTNAFSMDSLNLFYSLIPKIYYRFS